LITIGLRRLLVVLIGLVLLEGCLTGCHWRDPNVRKQQFLSSGTKYFGQGRYREAALEFQNAIKIDPRFAEAHYQLAQCFIKEGLWKGALAELSTTVNLEPQNWQAQIDLGNLELAGHQYQQAEDRASLVLLSKPDDVNAHTLLALALSGAGDAKNALAEMRKVIALAPDKASSYQDQAAVLLAAKQVAAAEDSYKRAVSLEPNSAAPLISLGDFYARQLRFPDAETAFQRAIAIDPRNPTARGSLAEVYLADGKEDAAVDVLKRAKADLRDNPAAYLMLGEFYARTGQTDKAYAEFSDLYRDHPKDPLVLSGYIQALIAADHLDEAQRLNDQALKENPNSATGLLAKGQILLEEGRAADSAAVFQSVVGNEPNNAFAHYCLGLAENATGHSAEALNEFEQAVKLQPNLIPAQKALARLALDRNELDVASAGANALLNARPGSADGYDLRGIAEARMKDYASAEADFRKAIELAPQDPVAYTRLGDVRIAQANYSDAEALYNQALQLNPAFTEALNGIVIAYDREKKPETAVIARIQDQIALAQNNAAYYTMLGQALYKEHDLEKAQSALEKAVALDGKNPGTLLLLSETEAARGATAQAIENAQRAIKLSPGDVRGYATLADLEEKSGDWEKAEQTYQQAMNIDPHFGFGAINLAILLLDHGGNADTALSLAEIAHQSYPDSSKAADTLAWAYVAKGGLNNDQRAVGLLQEALNKTPGDPGYLYHLGVAYERMKKPAAAAAQFRQVLKLDPGFEKRDEILKYLASLN
jgi:cellulose synthase operon protein C